MIHTTEGTLTERQEARRGRILAATAELANSGGFDAVQMREVADRANVALGTLYRYFPSKVHLLLAALHDRLTLLHETLRERPPTEPTPGGRVASTLLRAFRALQREPHLAEAMLRALHSAGRAASPDVDEVSRLTTTIIVDAMSPTEPHPAAVRVIEHTWHATLITWLAGRATIPQVHQDIETACRLADLPPQ
ncbi:TetR family transcriptional regulator [Streptomyces polyrhachis]|uniref:TetR family transcriptional regulator n=1 Tax=Streptomyces polyrhachis TaxID=1282885 RepID=A0ABW2GMF3_9ACTN